MANVEQYDDLVIGSGIAGKFAACTRDTSRQIAIVERVIGKLDSQTMN